MASTIEKLLEALTLLREVLISLNKYEFNFSESSIQHLKDLRTAADELDGLAEQYNSMPGGLSSCLGCVSKMQELSQKEATFKKLVLNLSNGSIPVPRSLKDDCARVVSVCIALSMRPSAENLGIYSRFQKFSSLENLNQNEDLDALETELDKAVRLLIAHVYGKETFSKSEFLEEWSLLKGAVSNADLNCTKELTIYLNLVLNSLERLHAAYMEESEEEDEEEVSVQSGEALEEDDEDDPFFMPMPGAMKWAEAEKFMTLAKPLTPLQTEKKHCMIVMDEEEEEEEKREEKLAQEDVEVEFLDFYSGDGDSENIVDGDSAASSPGTSRRGHLDFIQDGSPDHLERNLSAVHIIDEDDDQSASKPSPRSPNRLLDETPSTTADADANGATGRDAEDAASSPANKGTEASKVKTLTAASNSQIAPEKLNQFLNFLNGENPSACMFQAQMRLSLEGCAMLSKFLQSSSRVRALSLSHNLIGDEGIEVLCEGLQVNKAVTALDLPDNNITDIGATLLARALMSNQSLTQLQLSVNRIGDEGATELALLLRTNISIKKLGLYSNRIGGEGCRALTEALKTNQVLKHLQLLPGNPVEEKDAKALAKALKRNNKFSIKTFLGFE